MGIAGKYNKGGIDWGIETKDFKYFSLNDLKVGQVVTVRGIFVNEKSKFGPSPAMIADDCYFNLPNYLADTVKEMRQDPELVEAIKAGKVGAKVLEYYSENYKVTARTVEWVDL